MISSRKLCQIGLLGAFALTAAAAPAYAQDADKKKQTTQKKAEKPKSNSASDKDTTSNYPPTQVPGSGY
jgi:hypothetical protein